MRLFYTKNHSFKQNYQVICTASRKGLLSLILSIGLFATHCEITEAGNNQPKTIPSNTEAASSLQVVVPVQGKVISPFGYRGRHRHTGTDIKLHRGDTVRATFNGVVTMACRYYGYGNLIVLKHANHVETYYSHLSKCIVHQGDTVYAGNAIGLGGRTGRATTDHLHFEIRIDKEARNAQKYFDFSTNKIKEPVFTNPEDNFVAKAPLTGEKIVTEETKSTKADVASANDYIIQKGDTLYSIALRSGITVQELQDMNNMNNTLLKVGMRLKLKR